MGKVDLTLGICQRETFVGILPLFENPYLSGLRTYEITPVSQTINLWLIGFLDNIGSLSAGTYSDGGNQCPFNQPSEMWFYWDGNVWTSAGVGEIIVACMNGNFSKFRQFENVSFVEKAII